MSQEAAQAATSITNLYIYDIAGNSWSAGASMGTGANFPAGTVVGGKLWVIGGGNPFSAPDSFDLTQIYDPATNSWSNGPVLNQARSFADAVTLNGAGTQSALIVGGYNMHACYLADQRRDEHLDELRRCWMSVPRAHCLYRYGSANSASVGDPGPTQCSRG